MGVLLRLILLGVIAWLIYIGVRRLLRGPVASPPPADGPAPSAPGSAGTMRKCAQCGVHIPEGESTQSRGQYFCCEAHRDQFFSRPQ